MKKFTVSLLILLCLSFKIMITTLAATNVSEGFYKVANLNLSPNTVYNVENISSTAGVYILIFDGNQNLQQTIRLKPKSLRYSLIPLQPDFRIVVVGNGEASIS